MQHMTDCAACVCMNVRLPVCVHVCVRESGGHTSLGYGVDWAVRCLCITSVLHPRCNKFNVHWWHVLVGVLKYPNVLTSMPLVLGCWCLAAWHDMCLLAWGEQQQHTDTLHVFCFVFM